MTVGVVYRPLARNEHGDPIDADGNVVHADDAPYGEIDVISGGTSGSTRTTYPLTNLRGDVVSTEGMLGWRTDSRIQLQAGDTVVADGQKLKVIGPRLWGRDHALTGRPARWNWIAVQAN